MQGPIAPEANSFWAKERGPQPNSATPGLTPAMIAKIEGSRVAARKRKAARMAAIKNFVVAPVITQPLTSGQAPPTAPEAGGRPDIVNRRCREMKGTEASGHSGPLWPNDKSISLSDASHRSVGLFAIDTVNPNAWSAGADYMHRTSADVILAQEVRLPGGEPCRAAEQAARNAKWKLAVEPCLLTNKGGKSAGTAVATRSYIGMSTPRLSRPPKSYMPRGTSP